MTTEAYRVGDVHPAAQRPITPGDVVVWRHGFAGFRLAVLDVGHDFAECQAPNGARLRCKLTDLAKVTP